MCVYASLNATVGMQSGTCFQVSLSIFFSMRDKISDKPCRKKYYRVATYHVQRFQECPNIQATIIWNVDRHEMSDDGRRYTCVPQTQLDKFFGIIPKYMKQAGRIGGTSTVLYCIVDASLGA